MSASSNGSKFTLHRSSSLPFQQTQPKESAASELARPGLIQPRRHRPLCFMSFLYFVKGDNQGNVLHTYVDSSHGVWTLGTCVAQLHERSIVNLLAGMKNTQNRGRCTLVLKVVPLTSTMTLHTLHNPLEFQIVLRNIFNQLVQKSFLSTPQHGSSMINQNSWIRYFDPNDMLWKEPDVEWRTRATRCPCSPVKLWWSVAGGGRMDRRSFS